MLKELIKLLIGPVPQGTPVLPSREPKIDIPVIDEETKLKEEKSVKILEIILKDLKKYPPPEWIPRMSMSTITWYSHECLKYRIKFYNDAKTCDIDLISCDIALTLADQKTLYTNFYPAHVKGIKEKTIKEQEKQLAEFLDDSKRILCKDHD